MIVDRRTAPRVVLNGRFLSQSVTGVQRYAQEILRSAERLAATGEWPAMEILAPRGIGEDARACPFPIRVVGTRTGHPWEQLVLPRFAAGAVLVNLANTAPLRARRQVVVIHDAGAFDTPQSYSRAFRSWYRILHRLLARSSAQIATVSQFSRRRLALRLGIDPSRIAVVREGADHILREAPDPQTLARHALEPGRYALAVGSTAEHKNLKALAGAARMLADRGMTLAVVGALNTQVFAAGGGDLRFPVTTLGRVNDAELRALYDGAAALLFPSIYEGFGLPPVEALACGCPLVAASGSAVEEICGPAACLFDPADPDGARAALTRLLDTDGLAAELARAGKALVAPLTWDNAARDIAALVTAAASR